MQLSKALIAHAMEKGYKQAEIARELGVERAFVSMVKAGKRKFSPQQAVLVAELGQQDPAMAMELATIEAEENPLRRAKLMEILGKALAGGAVGMSPSTYKEPTITDIVHSPNSELAFNSRYLVSKSRALVRNLHRWAGNRLRSQSHLPASGSPKPAWQ